MNYSLSLVIVAAVTLGTTQDDMRKFTDASGKFTVKASLVDEQDGNVRLKKEDGSAITIPLAMLSLADQEYIKSNAATSAGTPSLRGTLAGMLDRMLPGESRPGVIVQVADKRVFINLGEKDGVVAGAEFEIVRGVSTIKDPISGETLGENRDVAGRIRADSVQEKMTICSLVNGDAEQKNKNGEFNQVLPVADTGITVSMGKIDLEPDAGVSESEFNAAIAAACAGNGSVTLASGFEQARYELRLSGKANGNAIKLGMSLVDSASGREIANTTGEHKTGISLAELGYKSALAGELGVILKPDPIRKALEDRFGSVHQTGAAFFIDQAGPRGEVVWVYLDGRVLVASKRGISEAQQLSQMTVTWSDVSRVLAGVTAELTENAIQEKLTMSSEVYTPEINQFQAFHVAFRGSISGRILNWPDAVAGWAALVCSGSTEVFSIHYPAVISIDEKASLTNKTREPAMTLLSDMKYGEHTLSAGRCSFFELRAFFPKPNGRIAMYDKSSKPTATREVFSRALTSVNVPVPVTR